MQFKYPFQAEGKKITFFRRKTEVTYFFTSIKKASYFQ